MKQKTNLILMIVIFTLALAYAWIVPSPVHAQAVGNNTICSNSTGSGCTTAASVAYIDASPVAAKTPTNDICLTLFNIISASTFTAGTVVDARGINASNSAHDTSGHLLCAGTPWVQSTSTTHIATILLPAATIELSKQWILPNMTRIIGEGTAGSNPGATILQACDGPCTPTFPTNLALLKMGTGCPSTGCTGVAIENLSLNGSSITGVGGITNAASQELSYVRNVNMANFPGTGLLLTTGATNSGPYSGITFTTSSSTSICASIQNGISTRGIQGLTCTGPSASPFPANAVFIDAPNNTLRDFQVSGFTNGVTLGNSAAVQSVVLSNISGGSHVTSVVHIASTNTVTDVAAMAIVKNQATNAIQDQTLAASHQNITDANVALYVIGEKITVGTSSAYSRFTTSSSSNAVNWLTGKSPLTVGFTCPSTGSLYSNTNGGTNTTWYGCSGGKWEDIK